MRTFRYRVLEHCRMPKDLRFEPQKRRWWWPFWSPLYRGSDWVRGLRCASFDEAFLLIEDHYRCQQNTVADPGPRYKVHRIHGA